ncbi:MAG: thymidylate synthase [Thaumarchaeota archaeon]|nr:MAG: thymidylate synthase [Nitrososphaerota archaeon]
MEQFTEDEKKLIQPFFSNLDKDVFALINMDEVIKGTLFSRYSRTHKSARRLLLDEFITDKDIRAILEGIIQSKGPETYLNKEKAEDFYHRVLVGYGDDSVAELAGAHIACENISSLAADQLTDSRIGLSYLEKSGRYLVMDKKVDGKFLWYRDPKLMGSKFADLYSETMDSIFETYSKWIPTIMSYLKNTVPREGDQTERAYENTIRSKACDVLKNMLPASRLTNLGLFGNGRAYEYLLTKLYSSELPEVGGIANSLHEELSKVIPAFVKRSQLSKYIVETREGMKSFVLHDYWTFFIKIKADEFVRRNIENEGEPQIKLIDYDQDGELKVLSAMLYPYSNLPLVELRNIVSNMPLEKRTGVINEYLSKRRNRRDKPGRALENANYTFEICASYGAFRDIHRHRILTLEKQRLTTDLGFDVPPELDQINLSKDYRDLMENVSFVFKKVEEEMPIEAQYLVPRAFHMRWYVKMNLREVYHLTELRSSPQGHPDYRKLAQNMKTIIQKVHPSLVENMQVDMKDYSLARLESEKKIDRKLAEIKQRTVN